MRNGWTRYTGHWCLTFVTIKHKTCLSMTIYETITFKNGPCKICERKPLKKLKWYDLFGLVQKTPSYTSIYICKCLFSFIIKTVEQLVLLLWLLKKVLCKTSSQWTVKTNPCHSAFFLVSFKQVYDAEVFGIGFEFCYWLSK